MWHPSGMNGTVQALHDLDGVFRSPAPPGCRRIAWDALSFCTPANWELAVYQFLRRNVTRIEMEDEYSVRLEAEWVRGHRHLDLAGILQRYEAASKPLTLKSDDHADVMGLPEGWKATHFKFKETGPEEGRAGLHNVRHELVTAFYLCPRSSVFCFVMLHFLPDDREQPPDVIRLIATTFQNHDREPHGPWQLFDLAFKLPQAFALEKAQFDIGLKLMLFTWRRRRLFLWHVACADVLLRGGGTPAEWACGHLNGARMLKAPVFRPAGQDRITWQRRRPYVFGHREEIATLCYRYDVGCRLIESSNTLFIWVFHHRTEKDLEVLYG